MILINLYVSEGYSQSLHEPALYRDASSDRHVFYFYILEATAPSCILRDRLQTELYRETFSTDVFRLPSWPDIYSERGSRHPGQQLIFPQFSPKRRQRASFRAYGINNAGDVTRERVRSGEWLIGARRVKI